MAGLIRAAMYKLNHGQSAVIECPRRSYAREGYSIILLSLALADFLGTAKRCNSLKTSIRGQTNEIVSYSVPPSAYGELRLFLRGDRIFAMACSPNPHSHSVPK